MAETNPANRIIGDDFEIARINRRRSVGRAWVSGRLNGHRFRAMVFARHAESERYELGRSQILKLRVHRLADKRTVFNWDRGLDVPAADETAQAIVDFLVEGLADHIFGPEE